MAESSALQGNHQISPSKLEMARMARQAKCNFSPTLKVDIVDSLKAHLFDSLMSEQGLEKTDIQVDDMPQATRLADGSISGGVCIHYQGGTNGTDYDTISVLIDNLTDLATSATRNGVQFFVKDDSLRITAPSSRDLVMLLNQAISNKKYKIRYTAEDEAYYPAK